MEVEHPFDVGLCQGSKVANGHCGNCHHPKEHIPSIFTDGKTIIKTLRKAAKAAFEGAQAV
jgi:hypothetical protein